MSNEIIYAIFFAIYSTYLSSPFVVVAPLGSASIEVTKDIGVIGMTPNSCFVLKRGEAVELNNCNVAGSVMLQDTFYVYFDSQFAPEVIRKYLHRTNEYIKNGMIGRQIFVIDTIIVSNIDSVRKEFVTNDTSMRKNIILLSDEELVQLPSTNIVVGYNLQNSYGNYMLVARLLPDYIDTQRYLFDVRVLVHEYLHIWEIGHDKECKSIMYGMLKEDMGWFNIKRVLQSNDLLGDFEDDPHHLTLELDKIEDFIFPAPTMSDCSCDSYGFDYLLDFENGEFIGSSKMVSPIVSTMNEYIFSSNISSSSEIQENLLMTSKISPALLRMDSEITAYRKNLILFRGFELLNFHISKDPGIEGQILEQMISPLREIFKKYQSQYHER